MRQFSYKPPWFLRNGLLMTLFNTFIASYNWEKTITNEEPIYKEVVFTGAQKVPIYGWVAIPKNPKGTIVATYGIAGQLPNQWFLKLLGRKAYALGYAVVLFDWRAHGKTAELSPTLTSDGLYEGEDFVRIAATAKTLGCPGKFWFVGYSLGGQLALWAGFAATRLIRGDNNLDIKENEIGGVAVICPSLDSLRSLTYLQTHPTGKILEKAIAKQLKKIAWRLYDIHPQSFNKEAIEAANSIWEFDKYLVIDTLGFSSVEAYYKASNALQILPKLQNSTFIIYACDDPLFDPTITPDLQGVCKENPHIDLLLTQYGGHVGYLSSKECQKSFQDSDKWWAWNRILQWIEEQC
jgi:uncharacterized protein